MASAGEPQTAGAKAVVVCRPAKHAHLSEGCSSDEELEAVEANEVCWAEVVAAP